MDENRRASEGDRGGTKFERDSRVTSERGVFELIMGDFLVHQVLLLYQTVRRTDERGHTQHGCVVHRACGLRNFLVYVSGPALH